jgi:transcriptional regulator with XRE-family HTH domain
MERSSIQLLHKRGKSQRQIARKLGRSPVTVARALREPVDRTPGPRDRPSIVAPYREDIGRWLRRA